MYEFLTEYGLFLAKTVTLLVAVGLLIVMASRAGGRKDTIGELRVRSLNTDLKAMADTLHSAIFNKQQRKQAAREEKARQKEQKRRAKLGAEEERHRVYVLDFHGDLRASAVAALREAITGVLAVADQDDEVVVRLESPGGQVHGYGLAASQLARIRDQRVPLTVTVDKVAASGGYLMACVADRILAAPFAVVGSIGVLAQLPNFHRLLKKNEVDFEQLTAGEYKRTLSVFGENTEGGRKKFQEELDEVHQLFKSFVREHRPRVDIDRLATGESWHGARAVDLKLVDELRTSDDYLVARSREADVYLVEFKLKRSMGQRLEAWFAKASDGVLGRLTSQ